MRYLILWSGQSLGAGPNDNKTASVGAPKIGLNREAGRVVKIVVQEVVSNLFPKARMRVGSSGKEMRAACFATVRRKVTYGLFCERQNGCGNGTSLNPSALRICFADKEISKHSLGALQLSFERARELNDQE